MSTFLSFVETFLFAIQSFLNWWWESNFELIFVFEWQNFLTFQFFFVKKSLIFNRNQEKWSKESGNLFFYSCNQILFTWIVFIWWQKTNLLTFKFFYQIKVNDTKNCETRGSFKQRGAKMTRFTACSKQIRLKLFQKLPRTLFIVLKRIISKHDYN